MAPGKAPDTAVDSTHKPMPEYPLDPAELIYPGQGDVVVHDPPDPFTVDMPEERRAAMDACAIAATAADRCAAECEQRGDRRECARLSRVCAAACRLLHDLLAHASPDAMPALAQGFSPVCARICRTCAELCEAHAEVPSCAPCAEAVNACAEACDALA